MKTRFSTTVWTFLTVVLMSLPALSTAKVQDKDAEAIKAASEKWAKAVNAGKWADVAALYSEDGMLLPPNMPAISGRPAIQEFLAGFPPISDMVLKVLEVDGGREWAYVMGTYTMTLKPEGADPIQDAGKFIEVRKKQEDGSWLIFRDIYNSDKAEGK